jgi:hypothetical protein
MISAIILRIKNHRGHFCPVKNLTSHHFYYTKNTLKLTYSTAEVQTFSGEDPASTGRELARGGEGSDRMIWGRGSGNETKGGNAGKGVGWLGEKVAFTGYGG